MMQDTEKSPQKKSPSQSSQFRGAIILPDGRKPIPLGSGTITALLGEGGMANVYEIWNSQLEVHRAVKLLHPNCSEESKQRFQTEIKITAKLHHPNIIEIHGVGDWNGLPLIEMEKIDGYTMENLIFERGALPVTVCTAIGIMIARALRYAHNQVYVIYGKEYHGVIHRDLKPSNIMLCKDGTVKLMDFGIARPTDASIHTTDGSILGTMQYLSPEQLEGKEPDVRTDIYSLGTTIYEVITGVQAFPERNVSKLMMNKIKNEYRGLDEFAIKIPSRLKRLVQKCMVHDREKRIGSAAVLLAELEKIHKSLTLDTAEQVIKQLNNTTPSERVVISSRRRLPLRAAVAVLALGVAAVSGFFVAKRVRSLREENAAKHVVAVPPAPPAQEQPVSAPPKAIETRPAPTPPKPVAARRTPSRSSPRPASPQPSQAPKPRSFIDNMIERHGTTDLLEIMVTEVNHGNYLNAYNVYDALPTADAQSGKGVIYRMRTLSALGKTSELQRFLSSHTVDDGEFHLAKAKLAHQQGRVSEAQVLLDRALTSPRQFTESAKLRQEVYYYKALCTTSVFDASPTETSYKNALDAWWQVRNELRSSPNHKYNQKAISETQRIGEKYRNSKG